MREGDHQRFIEDWERYDQNCAMLWGLIVALSERLGDRPPIVHHLFICRDLKKPLSEAAWKRFRGENYGRLPQEVAAWEKWVFFDGTAAGRFFGLGDQADVDWLLDALNGGGERVRKYLEYDVPKRCAWRLPYTPRLFFGNDLKDTHRIVELITRQMGERVEGGKIVGLKEAGLEMLEVDDFGSAAIEALGDWLPNVQYGLDPDEPPAPVAQPQSPYAFYFNDLKNRFVLRFSGDCDGQDVEFDAILGLKFYAKVLKKPRQPVTADDLYEIDRTKAGPNFTSQPAQDKEGVQAAYNDFERLTDEINEAREQGNLEKVKGLQKKRNKIQDWVKNDFNPVSGVSALLGNTLVDNPPRAAERVMRYALAEIGRRKMPKLQHYLIKTCTKTKFNTWQYEPAECEPRTEIPWKF